MAKTVALVLGGGGARGWAHLGVIRALEEANIPIDCIAGTSIGALIGAVYAVDAIDKLETFAGEVDTETLLTLVDISFPGLGLIEGKKVYHLISQYLDEKTFEQTRVPLRCVATNFLLNRAVVFQSGRLLDAVRASISIPGIFVPFQRDGVYLVDGGTVNPVPVDVAHQMGADVTIAVNLNHDPSSTAEAAPDGPDAAEAGADSPEARQPPTEPAPAESKEQQRDTGVVENLVDRYESMKSLVTDEIDDWIPDPETGLNIFDVIGNSMNAMEQRVTEINLQTHQPDVLIQPNLMDFGIFDFHQPEPIMQIGYETAKAMLDEIKQAIA